ncbi:MAG: LysM peptidoglycan-binding domain-containing protein [Bacteroidota bacterium]
MYRFFITGVLAFIVSGSVHAVTRDSIGVENYNGKKLVIHQIVAKDTYYSLGRRYNVQPNAIMSFNDNKFLQIGVIIKVPTNAPFSGSSTQPQTPTQTSTPIQTSTQTKTSTQVQASPEANTSTPATGNLIEHAVQKKENLNMLAEKYGTTVNEIKRINNLKSINLQIGQILKMPAPAVVEEASDIINTQPEKVKETVQTTYQKPATDQRPAPVVSVPTVVTVPADDFIEHTVAGNETMYSIATRYKLTMDQLKAKNNLTDNSLRVGQKLLIKGQYPVKPSFVPPISTSAIDSANSLKDPSLRYPASRYGLNQIDEKGTAVWIADQDLDPSKMLVLHRSAPIGTVMKITNPMSNRTTFAKVVGKFTENESTKDVIIVMTKAVADALGALDKRFHCNLTYSGQENEQK